MRGISVASLIFIGCLNPVTTPLNPIGDGGAGNDGGLDGGDVADSGPELDAGPCAAAGGTICLLGNEDHCVCCTGADCDSACQFSTEYGYKFCLRDAGGCEVPFATDLSTDDLNCGACGNVCGNDRRCAAPGPGSAAECICDTHEDGGADLMLCDGQCVHLDSDPLNCGSCGNACFGFSTCQLISCDGQSVAVCQGDTCPASCGPLETCDICTSTCRCGVVSDAGPLPPQCLASQFCGSFDGGADPQCFQPCDPHAQNCPALALPDGGVVLQGCYYEPAMNALVCEPSVDADGYEFKACTDNGDCLPGLDCFPLTAAQSDAGYVQACRYFCDASSDAGPDACPFEDPNGNPIRKCVPVALVPQDDGSTTAVGACQP